MSMTDRGWGCGAAASRIGRIATDQQGAIVARSRKRSIILLEAECDATEYAMLWTLSTITGYAVSGIDGHLGTVADLLFDDTD